MISSHDEYIQQQQRTIDLFNRNKEANLAYQLGMYDEHDFACFLSHSQINDLEQDKSMWIVFARMPHLRYSGYLTSIRKYYSLRNKSLTYYYQPTKITVDSNGYCWMRITGDLNLIEFRNRKILFTFDSVKNYPSIYF